MTDAVPLPSHVLRPRPTTEFDGADAATRRAGLGYAILRALGAHESLPHEALAVVARWSAEYGASHGGVTPDPTNLRGQDFEQRVGTAWGADDAARNASCYPGGRGGRPSYAEVFREVWTEARWPDLCAALRGEGGGTVAAPPAPRPRSAVAPASSPSAPATSSSPTRAAGTELEDHDCADILRLHAATLAELRRRGILRTNNPPAGDLAEHLVAEALHGRRQPNSNKSADVVLADGTRLQVKARVVPDPKDPGLRQLSPFRSFDFDRLAIVLFDGSYGVYRAAVLPVSRVQAHSTYRKHVNGHVLLATDKVLGDPEAVDLTSAVRGALAALSPRPAGA